jgi:hypothetical protein
MSIKRIALFVILAVSGIALASLVRRELWDGGFRQVEYRISFIDESGHPIKGVQLKVIDSQSNISWAYPVTDYTENMAPTSDEDGLMVFHHVDLSPEFGGSCHRLFFLFPIGECEAPIYTLNFLLSGQTVASFSYIDLESPGWISGWKNLPAVTRKWEQKRPASPSLPEHLRVENRQVQSQLDFYVINKTITLYNH